MKRVLLSKFFQVFLLFFGQIGEKLFILPPFPHVDATRVFFFYSSLIGLYEVVTVTLPPSVGRGTAPLLSTRPDTKVCSPFGTVTDRRKKNIYLRLFLLIHWLPATLTFKRNDHQLH